VQWQQEIMQTLELIQKDQAGIKQIPLVLVADNNGILTVTIPAMSGKEPNGNVWQTPALIVTTLPDQENVKNMTITPKGTFSSLQADQKTVFNFKEAKLEQVANDKIALTINQVTGQSGTAYNFSLEQGVIHYQTELMENTPLLSMFHILRRDFGLKNLLADATLKTIRIAKQDQTYQIDLLTAQARIEPNADKKTATVRNAMTITGLKQTGNTALTAYLGFIPEQIDLVGGIKNVPLQVLKGLLIKDPAAMQSAMMAAKTTITLDSLTANTPNGVGLTAQGTLKPDMNVPAGLTGRLFMNLDNLQTAMTSLQQNPTDMSQIQTFAGLMVLQSFGRQQDTATAYVLDLTPDGQILLNGKDLVPIVNILEGKKPQLSQFE
jgi:hypothetical protein